MRIRVPQQWRGDFLAMIGAVRIGEREIIQLADEYGWDELHAFSRQWFDYSERRTIEAIQKMPSGSATGRSSHDPFPGLPDEGLTIQATVDIDSAIGKISVDLRQNSDCLPSGVNLSEACARTAAMIGVFNSLAPDIPKNAGAFRRIDVKLRENCIAGVTPHPFSCSTATTNVADRVGNAVQTAIAGMLGPWGMAEAGAGLPASLGVISGLDQRTGKAYVNQILLGFSAGAATSSHDAWLTVGHLGNGGMCFLDSVELAELYQPLLISKRAFIKDTEGAGTYRGASSMIVEFGPVRGNFEIGYSSDGNINAPKGVCGGASGGTSDQKLRNRSGEIHPLPAFGMQHIAEGEAIVSISTGGGGYGNPLERVVEKVLQDVEEKWISRRRARDVYGVVVDDDGILNERETEQLRSAH